ncbi:RNA polymerase sigma factor [Sphingobium yanoikuyae]|uniref:Sigma-70 family RNA polymerase sigma factor n=1 Tax=Sphingobium yanoikuyae ATCC 51230 TaxID=883163 RepID=K9CP58_SPHYA|nr:RNA polymerase sigma factor [Sphingobium yanoikuyae]EKU74089.1 sigma-70 family RNA polymerase sigma factor [Sphingobium yanoikuyae ATCC 51230]WQE07541.1 RNA polymerase sigma factor [Sphingobium yanoikuyae]
MTAPVPAVSFDAFYRAQHNRFYHFFRRKVGRDAATDLVQEIFTRMLRGGAFDRLENPQAYLWRIAHNVLIERARTWHRKGCVLSPLDEARDAAVPPEQEWRIEAIELRRAYRRALLAMPRRTRRIFLMHRLKGLSYREISVELGVGEKGVEYHMMRALARCRRAFARWE